MVLSFKGVTENRTGARNTELSSGGVSIPPSCYTPDTAAMTATTHGRVQKPPRDSSHDRNNPRRVRQAVGGPTTVVRESDGLCAEIGRAEASAFVIDGDLARAASSRTRSPRASFECSTRSMKSRPLPTPDLVKADRRVFGSRHLQSISNPPVLCDGSDDLSHVLNLSAAG